ncbi:type III secretion protein [Labrenzia sp. OB1]|nr:type III secretion protein [Labrenzia sp. OB1]
MRQFNFVVIGLCFLLTGCKLDLYTGLTEREANEMLSILIVNGISARKEYIGDSGVSLLVEEHELSHAIEVLRENGFPRKQNTSIGKVFEKSGLMSSPFEEHIRYIYALSEEVSNTLNEIDGVLIARVHIVLPEDPSLGEEPKPSSAAVFIKHRRGGDLDFFIPQIRRLVSNAIEGVDHENVTVVLVEAEAPRVSSEQERTPIAELLAGLGVRATDLQAFWQIILAAVAFLFLLVFSNAFTLFAYFKVRSERKRLETGSLPESAE